MAQDSSSQKGFLVDAAATIGTLVGQLATVTKAVRSGKPQSGDPQSTAPKRKARLPRKLKKSQKKAALAAQGKRE
jgi:hypothetical protein